MKIAAFYENILTGAKQNGISLETAVRNLMKEGLELLYISGFSYDDHPEEIRSLMASTGIGVEGLYMFYDFPMHPEDTGYELLIDSACELGAGNVLLIPGMIPANDPEKDIKFENSVQALRRAVAYGQQKGIAVSMEDFDGLDAPYCTIDGLNSYMQAVPGLTCSFDTGNFVLYHEDELQAFALFKDRICTVHLKDRSENGNYADDTCKVCADGSPVYAAVVGEGYIQSKEILQQLKEMDYSGNVIVELYDYSPEHMLSGIADSVNWVKKQWNR